MSTSSRPASVTRSRLVNMRQRVVPMLMILSRAVRSTVRTGAVRLLHVWRASLQFRVIVSTMLLGMIVVLMLGSYLYQRIADGLVNDRILTARAEATSQAMPLSPDSTLPGARMPSA